MRLFFNDLYKKAQLFLNALKRRCQKRFSKSYKIVFIDSDKIKIDDLNAFDVILSPKYYWMKIEELPVKYVFQAREYAPSIFDGFIPKGDYSYKVIKQDDKFLLFAYDTKNILDALETFNIKPSSLHNVYFAQTEFMNHLSDIRIDDNSALINRNGKIIKVPLSLAGECTDIDDVVLKLNLSKNSVKLGRFNRFYEKQSAIKNIIYTLVFLIVLFLVELFYLNSTVGSQDKQKARILEQYSMPSTEIQLNTLLRQQERVNKQQSIIREKMGEIFRFSFLEGEYFKNIDASQTQISLVLHVNDRGRSEAVKSYFQKFFIVDEFRDDTNDIRMKIRYE